MEKITQEGAKARSSRGLSGDLGLFLGRVLTFPDIMKYYFPGNDRVYQTQTPKQSPLYQSPTLVHEPLVARKLLVALSASSRIQYLELASSIFFMQPCSAFHIYSLCRDQCLLFLFWILLSCSAQHHYPFPSLPIN